MENSRNKHFWISAGCSSQLCDEIPHLTNSSLAGRDLDPWPPFNHPLAVSGQLSWRLSARFEQPLFYLITTPHLKSDDNDNSGRTTADRVLGEPPGSGPRLCRVT